MKTSLPPIPGRQRGSILLIVLVTMSALSLFAFAATGNTRSLVETSSLERREMRVEALGDSAVAYVDQQLARDENWGGTGAWIDLGEQGTFRATPLPSVDPKNRHFLIDARIREAVVKLRAEFHVDRYVAPVIEHALATLGGDLNMMNVQITGDLLAVDTEGGVKDYDPVTGEWVTRDSGGDPSTWASNNTLDGDLMTYTGDLPGITHTGENMQMFAPMINPVWDLDPYLVPNPNRIITTQLSFNQFATDKQVVIVSNPGDTIDFNQCTIDGGVVVWSPGDWPQRGAHRNEIVWNACNFGLPSSDPASTKIGVLAPASRLKKGNNETTGYGLSYFHSIDYLNNADFTGSLWVVNELDRMTNCNVVWDPAMATVAYEGMGASAIYTPFDGVSEYHDGQAPLAQQ
jgi:hypothetical protein